MHDTVNRLETTLLARGTLSSEERAMLRAMARTPVTMEAGEDLVKQGERPTFSCLIVDGFAWRYKLLPGGGRQVSAVHVPGDFVDLHSFLLERMDHAVGALSPCRIAHFPHADLQTVTERFPNLTRLLWQQTLIDAAQHREWMVSLGRRDAVGRLGHLFCELYIRLSVVHLARNMQFDLPLSRTEMSDILGITSVHVTRSLMALQRLGLVAVERRRVHIVNWPGLVEISDFDPTYLQLPVAQLAEIVEGPLVLK
jgi:CRP-like cAMP-binding protein